MAVDKGSKMKFTCIGDFDVEEQERKKQAEAEEIRIQEEAEAKRIEDTHPLEEEIEKQCDDELSRRRASHCFYGVGKGGINFFCRKAEGILQEEGFPAVNRVLAFPNVDDSCPSCPFWEERKDVKGGC